MTISAQALDAVYGRSAAGVRARLERLVADGWLVVAHAETDEDGHLRDWSDQALEHGAYRIVFDSDSYFANLGVNAAYPEISVALVIHDGTDGCQLQVVLAPCAYSMFFGARG